MVYNMIFMFILQFVTNLFVFKRFEVSIERVIYISP